VLERLGSSTLGARFYAIRDRDSTKPTEEEPATRLYSWDAYHIENYLLEPKFVCTALGELSRADGALADADAVEVALKACAAETVGGLVRHRIVTEVDAALQNALHIGGDPAASEVAPSVARSVEAAAERVASLASAELVLDRLKDREQVVREELLGHLDSDEWRRTFRGRDVLAFFANRHVRGISYEGFRDLILARMREAGHQPVGMKVVLQKIADDRFP
jgi:hypothetical protein